MAIYISNISKIPSFNGIKRIKRNLEMELIAQATNFMSISFDHALKLSNCHKNGIELLAIHTQNRFKKNKNIGKHHMKQYDAIKAIWAEPLYNTLYQNIIYCQNIFIKY